MMAGPCRRTLVPATSTSLLLLAAGLLVATAAAETPGEEKKFGMRMWYMDEEESEWMDRCAETHEPLGVARGPLLMRRTSDEEARWQDRFSKPKDDAGGNVLEFDRDNLYYHALQAWVQRFIKESGGIKFVDEPHVEKEFQDLYDWMKRNKQSMVRSKGSWTITAMRTYVLL